MKKYSYLLIIISLLVSAAQDYRMMDAGSQLESALEDMISRSMYVLTQEKSKYVLKYKILDYEKGNRITRFATFGISEAAHGRLKVKAALYENGYMVGAWTIDSWIKGGVTGGDPGTLFEQVASEIMDHLRGDFY